MLNITYFVATWTTLRTRDTSGPQIHFNLV